MDKKASFGKTVRVTHRLVKYFKAPVQSDQAMLLFLNFACKKCLGRQEYTHEGYERKLIDSSAEGDAKNVR